MDKGGGEMALEVGVLEIMKWWGHLQSMRLSHPAHSVDKQKPLGV
jgi:hypothetical protein